MHSELVYAIGDSHVRTCSYHDRFLPLYIGPGFANCFLTAELAAAAEEKIRLNLARLPDACTVLLSLGEPDVRFHAEDRFGTRREGERALDTAVARYAATLERVRGRVRLAVLSVPPSVDKTRSALASRYNALLAARCAALAVDFIDLWPDLADARDGLLQPAFDADGIHLMPAILPALARALCREGLVDRDFPGGPNFAWSFNYRIPLTESIETRFWGDKGNAACADRLVDYLLRSQPGGGAQSIAVLNGREGYVALALAARGAPCVAVTDPDPVKRRFAQEVARFAQCPQLRILECGGLENEARTSGFSTVIDYNPGHTARVDAQYLEQISTLGKHAVVVATRSVPARYPALAGRWRIDEGVFGEDADEIIMDTRRD